MGVAPRKLAAAVILALAASSAAAVPASTPAAASAAHPNLPAPALPTAPAGSAAGGRMTLELVRVGGSPPFAPLGGRIAVRGVVWPYVGGQSVKVSIYRDGRKVAVQRTAVRAVGNGSGAFAVSYAGRQAGLVQVRAAHYATPLQGAFAARAPGVAFISENASAGGRGPAVRVLQSELNALHYAVPLSGTFDEGTARALIAYRKVIGLERDGAAGPAVFRALARGAGSFRVHYAGDGRHVEADLTRQVLAEIEPGGRVRMIYTMSSGKPSTPTVVGRFRVYMKTPGVNSEGMVDSNYFIRGYAIHGYAEVPTYAASHGCLRIPIPDAAAVYAWVREGTPVDVYDERGGGSHSVRGNAGP